MSIIGGVDWSDAPEPVSLEPGVYEVRIAKATLTQNKNPDKETGEIGHHVLVEYVTQNCDDPALNGKTLNDRFSTKRSARFMFLRLLSAIGVSPEDLNDYDDLAGHELKVQVALKKRPAREGEDPESIRAWPEVTRHLPLA